MHVTFLFAFSSRFAKIRLLILQGNVVTHWRRGEKYYTAFVGNLILFTAVQTCQLIRDMRVRPAIKSQTRLTRAVAKKPAWIGRLLN